MTAVTTVTTGETIVAACTGSGRAPRGVVRASGPRVPALLAGLVAGAPVGRGSGPAALRLGGRELRVLVSRFVAPASYTGEECFEVQVPGNPALVERVAATFAAEPGCRLAGPGEFTARAYLAGRLTLVEAEGVAAMIAAATDAGLEAASRLARGEAGAAYRRWGEEVATLLALVEAGIDFTDQEDVVAIEPAAMAARVRGLVAHIEARVGATEGMEASETLPLVVLVGRPNAGKSTLFNALLGRPRAVASPIAGTTRDVLAEEVDLGPVRVRLADVAGVGAVRANGVTGEIEAAAEGAALAAATSADVLLRCDPTGRFDAADGGTDANDAAGRTIRVRTFGDRPGATPPGAIGVCGLDGWGVDLLRAAIAEAVLGAGGGAGTDVAAVLPRHRRALAQTAAALREAAAVAGEGRWRRPELAAGALRAALDALGELTGRETPDDVLGRVFATFCVGK